VTYRVLPVDEWDQIFAVCRENKKPRPHPGLAQIVVAEEDGYLRGFATLQMTPFVEPIWVDPSYRGSTLWVSLLSQVMSLCAPGTHLYMGRPTITDRLARFLGFGKHQYLYEGVVK
jgi:hypothetical protein